MKKSKPINLNLISMHFPINAVSSILHRISGIILFLFIGIMLYIFKLSISSPEEFLKLIILTKNIKTKLVILMISSIAIYHIISGVRHILLDFGLLSSNLNINRFTVIFTFLITFFLSLTFGIFIW